MPVNLVRLANPNEATILSKLALHSKGHWGYDSDFLDSCKEELTYSSRQLLSPAYCFKVAALKENQITGFFALIFLGNTHIELDALFVDPEYIGQGWGKMLLISAIEVAKSCGAKSIKIQSDPFAEDFYLANGAIKIGELESNSIPGRFLPLLEICM